MECSPGRSLVYGKVGRLCCCWGMWNETHKNVCREMEGETGSEKVVDKEAEVGARLFSSFNFVTI